MEESKVLTQPDTNNVIYNGIGYDNTICSKLPNWFITVACTILVAIFTFALTRVGASADSTNEKIAKLFSTKADREYVDKQVLDLKNANQDLQIQLRELSNHMDQEFDNQNKIIIQTIRDTKSNK